MTGKLVGVFLWAQVLSANSNSILFTQHDLPTHKCLLHSLTLGHATKYFQAICVWAPFSPSPTSANTTSTFITLHPELNGYFPIFFKNTSQNKTLNFLPIPSSWHSNAYRIYQQVVLLGWILNTLKIIFTLKIKRMDCFNCSNFFFILHRVTFHFKFHASLE
jgi:hypothetical protein